MAETMIGVAELSGNPSAFIGRASDGERITVLRHNKPMATLVDPVTAARMAKIEQIEEDLRLITIGVVRLATDNGVRHRLEDVAAELGIDLDSE